MGKVSLKCHTRMEPSCDRRLGVPATRSRLTLWLATLTAAVGLPWRRSVHLFDLLAEIEDPRRQRASCVDCHRLCCSRFWRSPLRQLLPDGQAKAGSSDDLSRSLHCRRMCCGRPSSGSTSSPITGSTRRRRTSELPFAASPSSLTSAEMDRLWLETALQRVAGPLMQLVPGPRARPYPAIWLSRVAARYSGLPSSTTLCPRARPWHAAPHPPKQTVAARSSSATEPMGWERKLYQVQKPPV